MSWRSFKLVRVCRSLLSAESQACASAVDEMCVTKMFFSLLLDLHQDLRSDESVKRAGEIIVVVDARALYDAAWRPAIQSAVDKRAAIEILFIKDAMAATGSTIYEMGVIRAAAGGWHDEAECPSGHGRRWLAATCGWSTMRPAAKKKTARERRAKQCGPRERGGWLLLVADAVKKSAAEGLGVNAYDALDLMIIGGGILLIMTIVISVTVIALQYVKGKKQEVKDGEAHTQCQRM